MDEYISKHEAYTMMKDLEAAYIYSPVKEAYGTAARRIDQIPAADVKPVVHAYWIELPKALNPNENPCKCSNCGHVLSFMNYYPKSKYCDDCGARMDLEDGGSNE